MWYNMIKLSNNYNNLDTGKIFFTGVKKDSNVETDKNAVFKKIVRTSNEIIASSAERQVPENGKFKPVSVGYHIPGSQNMAKVIVECDGEEPKTQRRIRVGVHHQDRDRLTSNYIYKGTKKEVLEYLSDEKNLAQFIETIKKLAAETDKYYSNL